MRLNSEVSSQGLRQLRASIDVSELARLNYDIIARDVRVEEFWNKFAKHYSAASEPEFWPPPPLNRASQREDRGDHGERAPRSAVRLSYPFLVTIYRPTWDQFPPLTTDLIPEFERPYHGTRHHRMYMMAVNRTHKGSKLTPANKAKPLSEWLHRP